jgi:hypothetical protein
MRFKVLAISGLGAALLVLLAYRHPWDSSSEQATPSSASTAKRVATPRDGEGEARKPGTTGTTRSLASKLRALDQLTGSRRDEYFREVVLAGLPSDEWGAMIDYLDARAARGVKCDVEWSFFIGEMCRTDSLQALNLLQERGKPYLMKDPLRAYAETSPEGALQWYDAGKSKSVDLAAALISGISKSDLARTEELLRTRGDLLSFKSFSLYFDTTIEMTDLDSAVNSLLSKVDTGDPLVGRHPPGALGNIIAGKMVEQAHASGDYDRLRQFYRDGVQRDKFIDDNTAATIANAFRHKDPEFGIEIMEPRVAACTDEKLKPHLEKLMQYLTEQASK